jgi:signal transduction histidine kinase
MKTLLVDDDPDIRAFIGQVLRMRGHEVAAFADAETAWEAIQQDVPGLIILDWLLPGMDGLELCRAIRALPDGAHTEVLVMTAHDRPNGLALVLDAGANDYLLKPIDLDDLQVRLTIAEQRAMAALERRRVDQSLRESEQVQRALATLTRLANSTLELDAMLPRLCLAVVGAGNASHASVFLLAGAQALRLAATTLVNRSPTQTLGPLATHIFAAGQAARERRALYYNQVSAELARLGVASDEDPQRGPRAGSAGESVLATPLVVGEEVVGALALGSAEARHFADGDLERAAEIAQIIGSALRNAQLYRREQEVATQLRQVEHWRSAFLRVMAHEVRTPLGQIMGFSELLNDEAERLSERGQRYLANVQAAAARLGTLVQRSFDLLQLYGAEEPPERGPVEVGHLVEMAVGGQRARAEAKAIVLRVTRLGEPVEVEGDARQLHQVVTILLDNAVKFTPEGGTIDVTVQQAAGLVEIAVCDSGPGVPAELRMAIFEGGQGEDTLTRRHSGLGLSLLTARRIAMLHGGHLRLDAPEEGACFAIALPVRGAAGQAARAVASPAALRRQLVAEPSPLAVVYWGLERLASRQARPAVATLQGHERVVMVGRFAYVEAPPPGQPERRGGDGLGPPAAAAAPRLADLSTDPTQMDALAHCVQAALEGASLTVAGARLREWTGLPQRVLEAVCYAWEERGMLQVLQPAEIGDERQTDDFVVLRIMLSEMNEALQPPRGPERDGESGAG